ncbi:Endonuclease/Exonuclease/phosphatase family protein [Spironucleus salmonicida]|uniref:Endonuclease/Exonuclease/phosphatase family protein n=1 Tax=Spironucleus salmonicida TaxID=348837 RepID=V6LSA6_9EUKA|nr:Endonuclease/Exonuclease/phosphatase family protein [Spironucleus salmonicida]|eukprot:EST47143.1 Endonuclease/Exonuclease/phosphatase family protein [Spironucleus salmonicida]
MYNQVPLFKTLHEWLQFYGKEEIDQLFENGNFKVQPLQQYHSNMLGKILKEPLYSISSGYLIRNLRFDRNFNLIIANQMALSINFSEIERIILSSDYKNDTWPLYKNFPQFIKKIDCSQFKEKNKFTIMLKDQIGLIKNTLALANRNNLNIRATETNIVQFLVDEFPFSAIYNFTEQHIFIHPDLCSHFQFMRQNNIFSDISNTVQKLKQSNIANIKGWCAILPLVDQQFNVELQIACASFFCIKCNVDELEQVKTWANTNLGFLPCIYLHDNQSFLPSYFPYLNNFVTFQEYENMLNPPQISTETNSEGIKILSWNLQNQSTLTFPNSLNISFPFTSWRAYKFPKIADLIINSNADICCFSEAGPIDEIYKNNKQLNQLYTLTKCAIDTVTKLSPGVSIYTAILTLKKHKLIHQENLPFSKIAYSISIAREVGIITPNFEKLQPFLTFNSATFVVIEINDKRLACCAIYPNWQFMTEVVKYLQIKLSCKRTDDLYNQFGCKGKIIAGDFNITPNSAIYKSFDRIISCEMADNITDQMIKDASNDRSYAQRLYFKSYINELQIQGLSSAFVHYIENNIEGQLQGKEPITVNVPGFKDCLDYIMTDMLIKEKCTPYCEVYNEIIPNCICVSDHAPLVCVVDFK